VNSYFVQVRLVTERCWDYCVCRISPRCSLSARIAVTTLRSACVVLIALRACRLSEAMTRKFLQMLRSRISTVTTHSRLILSGNPPSRQEVRRLVKESIVPSRNPPSRQGIRHPPRSPSPRHGVRRPAKSPCRRHETRRQAQLTPYKRDSAQCGDSRPRGPWACRRVAGDSGMLACPVRHGHLGEMQLHVQ
jgi:hypothetical protein